MSVQAAEALLKIPKYQILLARGKCNFGKNMKNLCKISKDPDIWRMFMYEYVWVVGSREAV